MRRAIPGILLLIAGACVQTDSFAAERGSGQAEEVPFTLIAAGATSGITVRRELLIADASAWAALWMEHTQGDVEPQPLPPVEFLRESVVAVFLGTRPTGGFSVAIRRITREETGLTVHFQEGQPGKDVAVSQGLTRPFHIVRVRISGVVSGGGRFAQE